MSIAMRPPGKVGKHNRGFQDQSTQALIDRIKNRHASRDIGDFDIRKAIEEGRN